MQTKVHISIPTLTDIKADTVASLLAFAQKTSLKYSFSIQKNTYIHAARNKAIWEAVNQKATHLMFIDADIDFPADGIERLLMRQKDIVGGLYFGRIEPFPVAKVKHQKVNGLANPVVLPPTDLQEVLAVGTGFMLINMNVFKKIDPPFFFHAEPVEFGLDPVPFPQNELGEDVAFCLKARSAGFKVYLDSSVELGHIGESRSDKSTFEAWRSSRKDPHEQQVTPDLEVQ